MFVGGRVEHSVKGATTEKKGSYEGAEGCSSEAEDGEDEDGEGNAKGVHAAAVTDSLLW
jgi:hypothetical protein